MHDCLREHAELYNYDVLMLHSSLPEEYHNQIFTEPDFGQRRIILSTNIAESSITLPDVRYVLDFCYNKEITYNKKTMTEMLELHWGSKATMN
jgi:ATP-dependent RNA helicase TDRD9